MSSRRLKIAVKDHRNTVPRVRLRALRAAGHEFVLDGPADVLLIDLDPPYPLHKELLDRYAETGREDHPLPARRRRPDPELRRALRAGRARRREPRHRPSATPSSCAASTTRASVHTIGWTLLRHASRSAPATTSSTSSSPRRTRTATARSTDYQRDLNAESSRSCSSARSSSPSATSARSSRTASGRPRASSSSTAARPPQFAEIDVADVVVAGEGTFPHARDRARRADRDVRPGHRRRSASPARRSSAAAAHELYMDYIRYPFDAADGPLEEIVRAAARSEAPIADWKRRFVGKPFDARAFVALFERLAARRTRRRCRSTPTRSFTTLALRRRAARAPGAARGLHRGVRPRGRREPGPVGPGRRRRRAC